MKSEIHPQYGPVAIRCACGNVIETRSTKNNIQVEICSACHPFFTGKSRVMDTAGRIDRFKKKFGEKVNIVVPKKEKLPSENKAGTTLKKPIEKKEVTFTREGKDPNQPRPQQRQPRPQNPNKA